MNTQVIVMVKNCEEIIEETLRSYIGKVGRIVVFDTGSVDDTVKVSKSVEGVIVMHVDHEGDGFFDFGGTRNKILNLSRSPDYEWTLFIDDSYILEGNINLNGIPNNIYCMDVKIDAANGSYYSTRLIRTNCKLKYRGKVHEVIDVIGDIPRIHGFYLNDKQTLEAVVRTRSRNHSDLQMLGSGKDENSLFARAILENTGPSYKKYIKSGNDPERKFLCYIYYGHLLAADEPMRAVRQYLNASKVYPMRAGECFLFCYFLTGAFGFIDAATKCKDPRECYRQPMDEKIYGPDGFIFQEYEAVRSK